MIAAGYPDAEELCKAWLLSTPLVASLCTVGTDINIFIAMPLSAPTTAVTMRRVGGATPISSDIPYDSPRMSFDCWAPTRRAANAIASAIMTEVYNLGETGGWTNPELGRLYTGTILSMRWLPDRESDAPRFIVDATFTTISA